MLSIILYAVHGFVNDYLLWIDKLSQFILDIIVKSLIAEKNNKETIKLLVIEVAMLFILQSS